MQGKMNSRMEAGCSGMTSRVVRAPVTAPRASRTAMVPQAAKVLIANSKGGGHSFFGYHLAMQLLDKGHQVTILNDGSPDKLSGKDPFKQYPRLEQRGAQIVWGNPADAYAIPRGDFQVVYDNNGKDMESCQPLIDAFSGRVEQYIFVASAGAYEANNIEPMHVEGDKRKDSAGHVQVEKYLRQTGMPYTVFQPLYIYGPYTAKDCEQWALDRLVRKRPVLLPGNGMQLTSLSHVDDVASMLAAALGNPKAIGEHFNVCSDRAVTFNGYVKLLAQAMGQEANIKYYDPKKLGLKKGEGIPFRTMHFWADVSKAKRILGWKPRHNYAADAPALVQEYMRSGRAQKQVDFSVDDRILAAL